MEAVSSDLQGHEEIHCEDGALSTLSMETTKDEAVSTCPWAQCWYTGLWPSELKGKNSTTWRGICWEESLSDSATYA